MITTDVLDAYGDALRSALHAEADVLVPAFNGLERIRHRNTHPSLRDRIHRALAYVLPAHRSLREGDRRV